MKTMKLAIVDDEEHIIKSVLREIREMDIEAFTFTSPLEALSYIQTNPVDILLTDQRMPGMSGIDLVIESKKMIPDLVCLMMSFYADFDTVVSAMNEGLIFNYISKPWEPAQLTSQIEKAVIYRNEILERTWIEGIRLGNYEKWEETLRVVEEKGVSEHAQILSGLALLMKSKDYDLYSHSQRVKSYAMEIARAMGLDQSHIDDIETAGVVHDIGKIAIRDQIVYKENRLSESEYDEMKRHASIGADVLREIGVRSSVIDIVEQHHERIDGRGYPNQLKGDEILIEAKIIAVADAYDALTTDRVYRKGITSEEAIRIIRENCTDIYDFHVVDAFVKFVLLKV